MRTTSKTFCLYSIDKILFICHLMHTVWLIINSISSIITIAPSMHTICVTLTTYSEVTHRSMCQCKDDFTFWQVNAPHTIYGWAVYIISVKLHGEVFTLRKAAAVHAPPSRPPPMLFRSASWDSVICFV